MAQLAPPLSTRMTSRLACLAALMLFICSIGPSCGKSPSQPPASGNYRLASARLWVGERHLIVDCFGSFALNTAGSEQQVELVPTGESQCEAPSMPSFVQRWGGSCGLSPVTFSERRGRLFVASETRFSCTDEDNGNPLTLEPLKTNFILVARGDSGLVVEYLFERTP